MAVVGTWGEWGIREKLERCKQIYEHSCKAASALVMWIYVSSRVGVGGGMGVNDRGGDERGIVIVKGHVVDVALLLLWRRRRVRRHCGEGVFLTTHKSCQAYLLGPLLNGPRPTLSPTPPLPFFPSLALLGVTVEVGLLDEASASSHESVVGRSVGLPVCLAASPNLWPEPRYSGLPSSPSPLPRQLPNHVKSLRPLYCLPPSLAKRFPPRGGDEQRAIMPPTLSWNLLNESDI